MTFQPVIIDIRPSADFQAGHLEGSLSLTPTQIQNHLGTQCIIEGPFQLIATEAMSQDVEESRKRLGELGYTLVDEVLDIRSINPADLRTSQVISAQDYLALDHPHVLLDVRYPDEIQPPTPTQYFRHILLDDLLATSHSFDQDLEIYILCASGKRATTAASLLTRLGYNAIIIEGGIQSIIAAQ